MMNKPAAIFGFRIQPLAVVIAGFSHKIPSRPPAPKKGEAFAKISAERPS